MRKFTQLILLLVSGALLFTSCRTVDYQSELQVVEQQVADIHIKLTLLDRNTLIDRYGEEFNPFIDFPGKLPRRYFFIFDLEIDTETSVIDFSQKNMAINIGSDQYGAMNDFKLKRDWEDYNENDRQKLHRGITINETMKPVEFTVSPDNPYKGLLVFLVPVSNDTSPESSIILPATASNGDEGIIEIPFKLARYEDGEKAVPTENTGIFAE